MSAEANERKHISEELLERYSLQQLSEEQMAPVEEHLLICSLCQLHLNEVDEYIGATKIAARQITEKKASFRQLTGSKVGLGSATRRPSQWALSLTAAIAAGTVLLFMMYAGRPHPAPPSEVTLLATRGASPATVAVAPAHTALTIKADAPDIPAGSQVRLELADSRGKIVWQGATLIQRRQSQPSQITVQIQATLDAGLYWFRVYENDRLGQEYGLQIR